MKKFLCVFMTAVFLCGFFPAGVIKAAEDWEIPEGVIIPSRDSLPATEKLVTYDNFDTQRTSLSWYTKRPDLVGDTGTNHVGKMGAGDDATYALGMGQLRLTNHVIRCNMKLIYNPIGSYPQVLNLFYTNDANRVRLSFYSDGTKYQVLVQQFTSNTRRTEAYKTLPKTVFQGDWVFLKITIIGNSLALYIDSEDTPFWEYVLPLNAGVPWLAPATIAFKPAWSTLFIDNLLISEIKNLPSETIKPSLSADQTILLRQNFDQFDATDWIKSDNFLGGPANPLDGSGAYNFKGGMRSADLMLPDSMIEFNIKADYETGSGAFGQITPKIMLGSEDTDGYVLNLSADSSGVPTFSAKRFKAGTEMTGDMTVTRSTGPNNYPDAHQVWSYMKIEKIGTAIKFYFNDKVNPAYVITDSAPVWGGGIGFDSTHDIVIDNLVISGFGHVYPIIITDLSAEGQNYEVKLSGRLADRASGIAIVAAYNNGVIVDIAESPFTIAAAAQDGGVLPGVTLSIERNIPHQTGYNYAVYTVADLDTMRIMSKAYIPNQTQSMYVPEGTLPGNVTLNTFSNDNELIIDASIPGYSYTDILVMVVRGMEYPGNLPPAEDFMFLLQETCDSNGLLHKELDFAPEHTEDIYTVVAGSVFDYTAAQKSFSYLKEESLGNFIEELNAASDYQGLLDAQENNVYLLWIGADITRYFSLSITARANVCANLKTERGSSIFTSENVGTLFNQALTLYIARSAASSDEFAAFLSEAPQTASLDSTFMQLYQQLEQEMKLDVCAGVLRKKNGYRDFSDLNKEFIAQSILSMIYFAYYQDMGKILSDYEQEIGKDFSGLSGVSTEQAYLIFQRLNQERYDTYDDFYSDYLKALASINDTGKDKNGAGGSGGSGKISTVAVSNEYKPTQKEIDPVGNALLFADLNDSHWAYDYIRELAMKKIINGYDDDTVQPDRFITRTEFVKLMVSAFGLLNPEAKCSFSDIDEEHWSYKYVASAFEIGVVAGMGENIFGESELITRQDTAVIMLRVLNYFGVTLEQSAESGFTDSKEISNYATEAVGILSATNILKGDEKGGFRPLEALTRAEAAAILCRMLELI